MADISASDRRRKSPPRDKAQPLFPREWSDFMRARSIEAGGLVIMLAAGWVMLALASYSPADPSLNTAGPGLARNLAGVPGAIVADILLQALGVAAWAIAFSMAGAGWLVMRHRSPDRLVTRLGLFLPGLLLVAAGLAIVPVPASMLPAAHAGGSLGVLILSAMAGLLDGVAGAMAFPLAAILAGLPGLCLVLAATGIGPARLAIAAGLIGRAGGFLLRPVARGISVVTHALACIRLPARARKAEARKAPRMTASAADAGAARNVQGVAAPVTSGEKKEPAIIVPRISSSAKKATSGARPTGDEARDQRDYDLPLDMLQEPQAPPATTLDDAALRENAEILVSVLNDFGVKGEILKVHPGPVVTLYELEPAPGTKSARVIGLADDIARSMSAISVRVAVVPGRNAIGIELPNETRETVWMRELVAQDAWTRSNARLALVLGKDIGGQPIVADLARMPHLLVAGTTGSGKSVAVNVMILSLLYRLPPEKCRFIMIDPKMLELSVYDGIPHLLSPVVTDPGKAVMALKWTVREMEDRYRAMSWLGVRNIEGYNKRLAQAREKGEVLMRRVQTGFDPDTGKPVHEEQPINLTELPWIVVVVDEFADLMLVAGKEIEAAIQRLAQMARAAGIHLIMATQRPSVDVITGTIKANFPTRISFNVTSKIDSRTILGEGGAEQLLGQGDMLYMAPGGRITRVHGPFVSDDEVERIVNWLKGYGEPDYIEDVTEGGDGDGGFGDFGEGGSAGGEGSGDELYDRAVALVAREGKASTSFIQRHLQIGYNRAARIIEQMEKEGVVSPANHVGKREVLVGDHS